MPKLRDFLRIMVKENASDLVLKANGCPAVRVAGVIRFLGDQPLDHELTVSFLEQVLDRRGLEEFRRSGASDRALSIPNVGRFRCNAFHQCGDVGMVFRCVKSTIPSFKDLSLPADPLKRLAQRKRGLVLATGVAGSGKSTTLASMIEFVNRNDEQAHHHDRGSDRVPVRGPSARSSTSARSAPTSSPASTRRCASAVRQSPDVILIGEMRDKETGVEPRSPRPRPATWCSRPCTR